MAVQGYTDEELPAARRLGQGLAGFRIFVGLIFFLNGLAKVFGIGTITIGPYQSNLIDREAARFILRFEGLENPANGAPGTRIPGLKSVVRFMLDNFGTLQWVITLLELGVGLLLIVGLATRGAALIGLFQQLFLALLYASSNRWLFEQPHEYIPLLILTLVPAGRVWGLDAKLAIDRARQGRFPF